jgi:hypothetical protein
MKFLAVFIAAIVLVLMFPKLWLLIGFIWFMIEMAIWQARERKW